jgi:NADH:ubiquinone oxidoreductase subunit E
MGAMPLIAAVLEGSGMAGEGDSGDGRVSIRYNTCLGACALAPVMSVDHQLMGRITPDEARTRMENLWSDAQTAQHHSG